MKKTATVEVKNEKKQPNAILTFTGEQDAEFFGIAINACAERSQSDYGGSREISVRAENGNIVLGYKKELDV